MLSKSSVSIIPKNDRIRECAECASHGISNMENYVPVLQMENKTAHHRQEKNMTPDYEKLSMFPVGCFSFSYLPITTIKTLYNNGT